MFIRGRYFAFSLLIVVSTARFVLAQPSGLDESENNPILMIDKALEKIRKGEIQDAEKLIQNAAIINPELSKLNLGLGILSQATGNGPQAIAYLEKYNTSTEGRNDYRGYAAVGEIYIRTGQYNIARSSLEKAKELAPEKEGDRAIRAQITARLAQSLVGLNQPKQAVSLLEEAQAASLSDPEIQLLVADLASQIKQQALSNRAADAAIESFQSQLRDNPFNETAMANLGRCYNVLLAIANNEVKKSPKDPIGFLRSASLLRDVANLQKRSLLLDARANVLQAIEVGGPSVDASLLAAELEVELGGIAQAMARLDEVLKDDSNNARALFLKNRLQSVGAIPANSN